MDLILNALTAAAVIGVAAYGARRIARNVDPPRKNAAVTWIITPAGQPDGVRLLVEAPIPPDCRERMGGQSAAAIHIRTGMPSPDDVQAAIIAASALAPRAAD